MRRKVEIREEEFREVMEGQIKEGLCLGCERGFSGGFIQSLEPTVSRSCHVEEERLPRGWPGGGGRSHVRSG